MLLYYIYYEPLQKVVQTKVSIDSGTPEVKFRDRLGLSAPNGDGFLLPGYVTPLLSKLVYSARLIFLESTLPRRPHVYINHPIQPSSNHLQALMPVRRQYMYDGVMSPLGELLSLRAFGRQLAKSGGP